MSSLASCSCFTQKAVPAQLPAAQSVNVTDSVQTASNDELAARDRMARQVVFDRDAAEMIYQVIDSKTEAVVRQVPEEAIIRRRIYFRQLDRANEVSRRLRTDLTV